VVRFGDLPFEYGVGMKTSFNPDHRQNTALLKTFKVKVELQRHGHLRLRSLVEERSEDLRRDCRCGGTLGDVV
jgi:hypothetical protein